MIPVDDQPVAHELRGYFERQAAALRPGPLPVAVARPRRSAARPAGLVLATAVTVLGALGVVAARPWAGADPASPASSSTAGPTTSQGSGFLTPDRPFSSPWRGFTVPAAGDLSRDERWLAAARARIEALRAREPHGTLFGDQHVVFAGRLPVGAGLITTSSMSESDQVALWSPTGRAEDLVPQPTTPRGDTWSLLPGGPTDTDASVAFRSPDGTRMFAIVPFDSRRVEVSAGPRVAVDGTVTRTWTPVPLRDGAAVGTLGRAELELPAMRLDGRVVPFLAVQTLDPPADTEAWRQLLRAPWGADPPDDELLSAAFLRIAGSVDLRTTRIEPVLHTRLRPSDEDVVAAQVHLPGGGTLQVVTTRVPRHVMDEPDLHFLVVGRAVAPGAPIAWLDYLKDARDGGVHGRARMARPGAARFEIRDVGARPCTSGDHVLGRGRPGRDGLAEIVVDLPERCEEPVPYNVGNRIGYPTIQVVALDAAGRVLGRGPLQQTYDGYLPAVPRAAG